MTTEDWAAWPLPAALSSSQPAEGLAVFPSRRDLKMSLETGGLLPYALAGLQSPFVLEVSGIPMEQCSRRALGRGLEGAPCISLNPRVYSRVGGAKCPLENQRRVWLEYLRKAGPGQRRDLRTSQGLESGVARKCYDSTLLSNPSSKGSEPWFRGACVSHRVVGVEGNGCCP